jgi:transposase, IS5 family
VPADIRYPNDLGLLNQAREQTERTIDKLYKRIEEKAKRKPRTYRNKARKEYLLVAKKRKVTRNDRRKAVKKQLQYIRINLETIEKIANEVGLEALSKREYRLSLVVAEVNRQQLYMYESNENRIDDRIVSLTQPHGEHPTKEYIANRLFESIEKLELVLNNLLNEGELIIKWDRKLKNKGNTVNVV